MKKISLITVLFLLQFSFSQDYKAVDSIVENFPKQFESIQSFADKINSTFNTDLEKVRATYYWISNNIEYDFKSYNSVRISSFIYNDATELKEAEIKYAEQVLKSKTGVCEGYSQLLKYTLIELDIECEVISGYGKTDYKEIGKVNNEDNHAWNGVFIDDEWKFIDATWSTGNDEQHPGEFNFNDSYFLLNPEQMIWSHFPKNKKWQPTKKHISRLAFFYSPLIHHGFYTSHLELSNMRGILKSKKIIEIPFNSVDTSKTYYYQFPEESLNLELIHFNKRGNKLFAEIPYTYKDGRELIIFDNNEACLSYKIN